MRRALISGGTGALGALVTGWLHQHLGVSAVLLLSRSGQLPVGACALLPDICTTGMRHDVASQHAALSELVPVDVVVHAAGVLHDASVGNQTPGGMLAVMAPKVSGARRLLASCG